MDIASPKNVRPRSGAPPAVALVTSRHADELLVEGVRKALGGFPFRLALWAPEGAAGRLASEDVALVIHHVADASKAALAVDLVSRAAARPQPVKVIAVAEPGLLEHGVALLRAGAAEFLERPLDLRRLAMLIDVLTVRARLDAPAAGAAPVVTHELPEGPFVYSPEAPMGRVMDQLRRVAPVDTTVLLQGETGTGKTRLARVIHNLSPRAGQPFLVVNCAALSPTLIESEMFGHVRGAFTGADRDRTGKFAEAAGGTLFLDEIDSLPVELQAKLLRVVEDRVFERVGSNSPVPMRARLVAAANRPLEAEVKAGRFRADLFFRLNVVSFHLPPLRERAEVFPALVDQFVRDLSRQVGRDITGVSPDAMAALNAHPWPGNVRELRNAIERAVALRPAGEIQLEDLPESVAAAPRNRLALDAPVTEDTGEMVALTETGEVPALPQLAVASGTLSVRKAEAEAAHIREVLQKNRNNRARTAAELGISRETLYKKLHRYGLFHSL